MPDNIGIMQGRLSRPAGAVIQCFPRDDWESEFALAASAGLRQIEWIYDCWGADVNPIGTDDGVLRMKALARSHGVAVRSICADWFIEQPLVGASGSDLKKRLGRFEWLCDRARSAGLGRVVLPFVDQSKIHRDEVDEVAELLGSLVDAARRCAVEIHLESDLAPVEFERLLGALPADVFKVNYDTGNSASLGYAPSDEFEAYGDRVGSVHIKDRRLAGGTVPLGVGSADFVTVFRALARANYAGDYILQVARGASGDEVQWAAENRKFVEAQLRSAARRPDSWT